MSKTPVGYHINADRRTLPCYAQHGCPLKDHNGFPAAHFPTEREAEAENAAMLAADHDPLRPFGSEQPIVRQHMKAAVLWNAEFNRLSSLATEKSLNGEPFDAELDQAVKDAKKNRNEFKTLIENAAWDHSDGPRFKDRPVTMKGFEFSNEEARIGLYDLEQTDETAPYYATLSKVGDQWVSRLSTAELKALHLYKQDSTYYAMGESEPEEVEYLHSALKKAPKLSEPVTVYATLNSYRATAALAQLENGNELVLDRCQSTSLNPYVPVTFMDQSGDSPVVTVEFKTKRAACVSGFGSYEHEMEVIVPPSRYRVTKVLRDVRYGAANPVAQSGTAAYTLIVEEVEDE